jgi:Protein of unknown function (DUF1499)
MEATPADHLPRCPPGSQSCIFTVWTPQKGNDSGAIADAILDILKSYPQEGQAGVDKGGWKIKEGDFAGTGKVSVEYRSGISLLAILLHCGKPFIDDLHIKIVTPDKIELRSSSRVGKADFGVNKKRLLFLGEKAKALGWDVPEPNY